MFFPARANKLYELWRNHGAWRDIDPQVRAQIESKYFKRSFEAVYEEVREYFMKRAPGEIEKADANPRHRWPWYFDGISYTRHGWPGRAIAATG